MSTPQQNGSLTVNPRLCCSERSYYRFFETAENGISESRSPGVPESRSPGVPESRSPGVPESRKNSLNFSISNFFKLLWILQSPRDNRFGHISSCDVHCLPQSPLRNAKRIVLCFSSSLQYRPREYFGRHAIPPIKPKIEPL